MSGEYLIVGRGGQLARALAQLEPQAIVAGRPDLDLTSPAFAHDFTNLLASRPFRAVINASAYTKVDLAEGESRADAMRINAQAVSEMARACATADVPLVHFSTDYVFAGNGQTSWKEADPTGPINAYGESKLTGERFLQAAGGRHLVFRTSWVYDAQGLNFFNAMLRLFTQKETLTIVSDQVGAPTYAPHLAKASLHALEAALALPEFPSGVYHLCGGGETNWHAFAQAIFALATGSESRLGSSIVCRHINPILSRDYPTPAARPLNSRLDCGLARRVLGAGLPDWRDGLKECFEVYANTRLSATGPENRPAEAAGG